MSTSFKRDAKKIVNRESKKRSEKEFVGKEQCNQIGWFIGLWATFYKAFGYN